MDRVEQCNGVPDLVRLQSPDEVQFQTLMPFAQRRPFGARLLNPIFAEDPLSGRDDRLNRTGAVSLGNRQ